jgi:ABC-2 type transport system permease protein
MLTISNAVAALGSFFLSRDLELILASPLSPVRFFIGRSLDVVISSSWMVLIFAAPVIIAFGQAYGAAPTYYAFAAFTTIPFLLVPLALGLIAVALFTALVPASRTREVLFGSGVIGLIGVYYCIDLIGPTGKIFEDPDEIVRIIGLIAAPNKAWLPSYWIATVLSEYLVPSNRAIGPYVALLTTTGLTLILSAYIAVRLLHARGYTRARTGRAGALVAGKRSHHLIARLTPFIDSRYRAILAKEYRMFTRDLTQALQLLMLLGICMLYLYNFRMLHSVRGLPEATEIWWRGFLAVSNLAMGAFVITAICTRFVFPSLSLEGQSWWVLQTAPLAPREILQAKFYGWLVPVGFVSSVIFIAGAFAIGATPYVLVMTALTSWIIAYGIVGLAVGLGAVFANFDWEHSSQLAASFGSLVFMLLSTILIFIDVVPALILVFLRSLQTFGYDFSTVQLILALGTSGLLLFYINYAAARAALRAGERALSRQ